MAYSSELFTSSFQKVWGYSAHLSTLTANSRVGPTRASSTFKQADLVTPTRGSRPPPPRRPREARGSWTAASSPGHQGSEESGRSARGPRPGRTLLPCWVAAPQSPRGCEPHSAIPRNLSEASGDHWEYPPAPTPGSHSGDPADPRPWQRFRGMFPLANPGNPWGLSCRRGGGSLGH